MPPIILLSTQVTGDRTASVFHNIVWFKNIFHLEYFGVVSISSSIFVFRVLNPNQTFSFSWRNVKYESLKFLLISDFYTRFYFTTLSNFGCLRDLKVWWVSFGNSLYDFSMLVSIMFEWTFSKTKFFMNEKLWNKAVEESKHIQNKINGNDIELPGKLGFEPHDTGPLSESWQLTHWPKTRWKFI